MPMGDGIRRNVATISQEERDLLRDAIIELQPRHYPGGRNDVPLPGGVSFWFKQDEIHQATHVHGGPAFLPWHRELCNRFEMLLREVDPLVSLHYWDWNTDPSHIDVEKDNFINLFTKDFMGSDNGPAGEPWLSARFYDPKANPYRGDHSFDLAHNNPFYPPRILTREKTDCAPRFSHSDNDIIEPDEFPEMRIRLERNHNKPHKYIRRTQS